ncbi:hypothetical protein [Inconstantimicrobium porci]|uniref:hypothetical protein n=1 Tax=Inconstantimicrobium porci TaxID=2652291 RepID=UPI00240941B1|nr:hypothetical protein [Inconstantimicrobium porci]MDD6770914.1 hypothetical protein [Inconstantimicrobium porci]
MYKGKITIKETDESDSENKKAWNLYYKLGFKDKKRPDFLPDWEYNTYLAITEYMLN